MVFRLNFKDFFALFVVGSYLLHMIRGFSLFYPLFPLVLSFIFIFIFYKSVRYSVKTFSLYVLSFFIFILPLLSSYMWYPDESYLNPFSRYLFMLPYLIFCIVYIDCYERLVFVFKVFAFFVVLGGLSIFYQVLFGPIYWFSDASEREGLVRYASLLGSLTSFGIFAGLALPIIYEFYINRFVKSILLVVIIISMLITLQKAAIINLLLFLSYIYYVSSFNAKFKLTLIVMFLVIPLLFLSYYLDILYVVATIDNVFRFKEGAGESDVQIIQSVVDRLWLHPSSLYEMHGLLGMILGVGMAGGSGTLGLPEYPMAHNGFFDLFFIGGVLYFILFSTIFVIILLRIFNVMKNDTGSSIPILKLSLFSILYIMLNTLFSGLLFFQPYGGVIFFSILAFFVFNKSYLNNPNKFINRNHCV